MTNFDKLKSMSIEELTEFLNVNGMYDNTPWMNWWDKQYCDKCLSLHLTSDEAEDKLGITPFLNETYECPYCEVHNKCKYFPELEETPSMKEIIKLWLQCGN